MMSGDEFYDDEVTSGLDRDCGCLTHSGPHWRHIDRLDRERNQAMLAQGLDETQPNLQRYYALTGYIQEEQRRLEEKLWHLSSLSERDWDRDPGE